MEPNTDDFSLGIMLPKAHKLIFMKLVQMERNVMRSCGRTIFPCMLMPCPPSSTHGGKIPKN